ncbi:MAG: HXXEE domain-containing protein [Anaerolineales bacterium]|nr:HXXEE domain-containing protein [Anaerolineales bacterium]
MTLKGYFIWFKDNWQKTGVIVSLFLTIYLVVIVLPKSTLLFALLMSTPLYMLHEIDEYIFPGKFAQFMNQNIYKTDPETGLVDTNAIFVINMVVWIAMPLYSLWAVTDLTQAAWMPYFYIFQAVLHLILGIVGKRFLNPGMVSAWLVHVPWGIWTIWLLVQAGVIANPYWNDYLLQGLEVILYMSFAGFFLWIRYRLKHKPR